VVLSTKENVVAGLVPLDEGEELMNRWVPYVGVEDVGEPPARALPHEGEAPVRGEPALRAGRFSVITDPGGASLAVVDDDFEAPRRRDNRPASGTFCWHEIVTADPERAKSFYCDVLGWRVTPLPQGDQGTYWMFLNDQLGVAGVRPAPPLPGQRAFWLSYIAVDDVDRTALRVEQLGGNVMTSPRMIDGFGEFATMTDELGGFFAVLDNRRT
jgi:predicted enzyme related to lactoylglutathione lyase